MAKLNSPNVIYSTKPASGLYGNPWLDGSIVGNGQVGVAITGAFANERLLVNHTELKHRGYTGVLQDVGEKLPVLRKAFQEGKVLDAERTLSGEFAKRGCRPAPEIPLPVCELGLFFQNEGVVTDYVRVTDMRAAEVVVEYKVNGTAYERRTFVDRKSGTIAYNVARSGSGKVNVRITADVVGQKNAPEKGSAASSLQIKYENGFIYFANRITGGVEYGLVARIVIPNGEVEQGADFLQIRGADSLTIFAKPFIGGSRDSNFKELKNQLSAIKNTYDKMHQQSEGWHVKLWDEMTLNMASSREHDGDLDVPSLLSQVHRGTLPVAAVMRLWNLAKYIAICAGGHVMTPGGVWTGDPGDEKAIFSFNNTAQLLYGRMMNSVNPEATDALFEYFERYAQDLRKNASRAYGATGYFVPNTISPESALFGGVDSATIHFIASSALAANLFYNYFLATGDTKVLKSKIFPFMCEVFNFYSDFLKLDAAGVYTTIPSYSPESTPGNTIGGKKLENFAFATNSTIDFLAIGALLDNLTHAATVLGDTKMVSTWDDMRAKIPQLSVGSKGELREYSNSAFIDAPVSRGNLHCYGLYPLKTISFNDYEVSFKPAIALGTVGSMISVREASANAIHQRLSSSGHVQSARTLAMYAAQLAHAGDADGVRDLLVRLLGSSFSESGLALSNDWRGSGYTATGCPSLDISSNIGFADAIGECLIQSDKKTLRVLPTLLKEWEEGSLSGITTDFSAMVSVEWNVKKGRLLAKIMPRLNCKIDIQFGRDWGKPKDKALKLDDNHCLRDVKLTAGKLFSVEF